MKLVIQACAMLLLASCTVGTNGTAPAEATDASQAPRVDKAPPRDASAPAAWPEAGMPEAAELTALPLTTSEPLDADVADSGAAIDAAPDVEPCSILNCGGACCGARCIPRNACSTCEIGHNFCAYSATVPNSNGACVDYDASLCESDANGSVAP